MKYRSLYERLVANTRLSDPENPDSCWIWTGPVSNAGYPLVARRVPGVPHPRSFGAHRIMLEEALGVVFPDDEAGHLCDNSLCINPNHLEVQTHACNLAMRPGYFVKNCRASWIPVLFPRVDSLQDAANRAWRCKGRRAVRCPF